MDPSDGERLAYWLRQRKMTQSKLAELIGVDRSTVSDWVTGVRTPLLSNLRKAVKVLHLTMGGFYSTLVDESPSTAGEK